MQASELVGSFGREAAGRDRSPPGDRDPEERLALARHGRAVLVPVRVLPTVQRVEPGPPAGARREPASGGGQEGPYSFQSSDSTQRETAGSRRTLATFARWG